MLRGARFFEKHIVIDEGIERVDYQAAKEGMHLFQIRQQLNVVKEILGENKGLDLNNAELIYRKREKKLVAMMDIEKGDIFTEKMLGIRRHEMIVYMNKEI